jgi:hypothetical protein
MKGLITGAYRELPASAPGRTRLALKAFRSRLNARRIAGGRENFEEELEAFLQGDAVLRAATERYLANKTQQAAERVVIVLEKMESVVRKYKKRTRSQ